MVICHLKPLSSKSYAVLTVLAMLMATLMLSAAQANDNTDQAPTQNRANNDLGNQVREAVEQGVTQHQHLTLVVKSKDKNRVTRSERHPAAPKVAAASTESKADLCATGKRQSPIHIEESNTLRGPAEPLQFNYSPSNASVLNNGHTIQVDVSGENGITVRDSNYKLLQFHFHRPSEEQIDRQHFAMVAHLVHQNSEGQLAVVAVLLEPGTANALINKVWTYMPLDTNDRVRMPTGLLNLNELLPQDQRYYQFMGSLTTPPCTEGVLWLVLKQPTTLSPEQIKLFSQLFPHNARPIQPSHGRVVRNAQ